MSTSGTDRLVGALADTDRRRAFAAVQLGARTLDDVVIATGLATDRAAKALGKLADAGIVVDDGGLRVPDAVFHDAARAALSRPVSDEHVDLPAEQRRVVSAFVVDGRITQIPAARGKRLVILDWLAQDFEVGRRYSEPAVNLIIGRRHPDTAALRRYLVDEGLLDREAGEYWRSGGSTG